ncbi:MAG: sulfotransferase [Galbibacter orientalis]|uniref:sulfotransferase family protein n=1 Tax=Galbibacter orientalis TaxID=453852 RepID=UPI003002CA0C
MKLKLVYLLGAGRSGTTIMATILGGHPEIETVGELHQFLDHIVEGKNCSCEESLKTCSFWKAVLNNLKLSKDTFSNQQQISNALEQHRNIPSLLFRSKPNKEYLEIHEAIFEAIKNNTKKTTLLDSSKYISRYLLLKRSAKISVKGIYVVRDVRGVINSFQKKVQTSRSPFSTILYYSLVNLIGQWVCWTDKNVMKVKYEDFIEHPEETLNQIYEHVEIENKESFFNNIYDIPHIIGGNRLKHQKRVTLKKDEKWKEVIPRYKQIMYYLFTFPLMMFNKYKV